jgi:hypothetical protein
MHRLIDREEQYVRRERLYIEIRARACHVGIVALFLITI